MSAVAQGRPLELLYLQFLRCEYWGKNELTLAAEFLKEGIRLLGSSPKRRDLTLDLAEVFLRRTMRRTRPDERLQLYEDCFAAIRTAHKIGISVLRNPDETQWDITMQKGRLKRGHEDLQHDIWGNLKILKDNIPRQLMLDGSFTTSAEARRHFLRKFPFLRHYWKWSSSPWE